MNDDTTKPTRRAVLTGALALAACRAPAPVTTGRKKVRLTYGTLSVARLRGALEHELATAGIDVEWLGPYPNHAPTLQAVATGAADFSFGGSSTPAAQSILSGSNLVFVGWSVSTPRTTSIIALPSSGIRHVRDLAGKTVAVNKAGIAEFLLVAALEKHGVPRSSVRVAYMNPPDAAPAFASGKIDAWSIWSGPLELAEVKYGAVRIFEEGKELTKQIDFGTFLVRRDYAEREAETVRKVIAAYKAEAEWSNEHPAEAQALTLKVSRYPKEVVDKIIARRIRTTWSLINDEGVGNLQAGVDWLVGQRVLSGPLDVAAHSVRV